MALRPERAAQPGVVGAPVARTASTVGTVAVVVRGVSRRQNRRQDRPPDQERRPTAPSSP